MMTTVSLIHSPVGRLVIRVASYWEISLKCLLTLTQGQWVMWSRWLVGRSHKPAHPGLMCFITVRPAKETFLKPVTSLLKTSKTTPASLQSNLPNPEFSGLEIQSLFFKIEQDFYFLDIIWCFNVWRSFLCKF